MTANLATSVLNVSIERLQPITGEALLHLTLSQVQDWTSLQMYSTLDATRQESPDIAEKR